MKVILLITLLLLGVISLLVGATEIPLRAVFSSGNEGEILREIILFYRLPKLLTAIFTGISLSLSGWVLQEYFKNPLAGPSILGVSSFSGLGAALFIVGGISLGIYTYNSPIFLISFSLLGGLLATMILVQVAKKVHNASVLIITGFMLSSLAGALISVLQFYAHNQSLKSYVVWSFGSLNGLDYQQIAYYGCALAVALGILAKYLPDLEKMQLGETYAQTMGVDMSKLRRIIILISSLLVSVSTALVGPIAFIGLAVPHICRSVLKTADFRKLAYAVALGGANTLTVFSLLSELFPAGALPVNVISSLFGVPIVLSILWKQKMIW